MNLNARDNGKYNPAWIANVTFIHLVRMLLGGHGQSGLELKGIHVIDAHVVIFNRILTERLSLEKVRVKAAEDGGIEKKLTLIFGTHMILSSTWSPPKKECCCLL